MARPELGVKHICPECEKKFYDLNRDPAVCPGCGHVIESENQPPEDKEIPMAEADNAVKAPETGDDFNDDEAGVIDNDNDLADLAGDDKDSTKKADGTDSKSDEPDKDSK